MLDTSVVSQKYIEDCEVCCNPIEINVTFEDSNLCNFEASDIEQ